MSSIAKTSTRWSPLLEVARVEPLLSCDRGDITRVRDTRHAHLRCVHAPRRSGGVVASHVAGRRAHLVRRSASLSARASRCDSGCARYAARCLGSTRVSSGRPRSLRAGQRARLRANESPANVDESHWRGGLILRVDHVPRALRLSACALWWLSGSRLKSCSQDQLCYTLLRCPNAPAVLATASSRSALSSGGSRRSPWRPASRSSSELSLHTAVISRCARVDGPFRQTRVW
jgi:hypothetical protein